MTLPATTKLDESIHILNTIMNSLNEELDALFSLTHQNLNSDIVAPYYNLTYKHGLIQVASYLDEKNDYFLKNLDQTQKQQITPCLDRIMLEIDKFPDIKKYRNNVLAHNLRKNAKNVYVHGDLRLYAVPQNLNEYMFLIKCLKIMTITINQLFPNSYDQVLQTVKIKNDNSTTPYKNRLTENEITKYLDDLEKDLTAIQA